MKKKKRLKIKKKALYIGIFILIFIAGATYLGINYYKEYKYKQTDEYKLIEHGYSKEEALKLLDNFNNPEEINHLLEIKKNSQIIDFLQEKYYLKKNLDRYLAYASENNETSISDVVAIVNVNRDYDYYENIIDCDTEKGILLNVNKYYALKEDYEPSNLTKISIKYSYDGNSITEEANDAYVSLWKSANKEGFTLIVNSSYRSYTSQDEVYSNIKFSKGSREADKVAARPGHSEHQTGLAIDVFEKGNQSTETFKDSEAYQWLKENSYLYGFIERYPENKEYLTGYSFEAWHYRYVGEDVAKVIHDENITFDEYYAYYVEK